LACVAEALSMTAHWDDNQPIYWQLREKTVAAILDGTLAEGEPLPSVRQVAVDFQINPLTVSKAYQSLVDDQLVDKRRGVGMFVRDGARSQLLASEREKFLKEEWPRLAARIEQLGLSLEELIQAPTKRDD
jgi:GntR family transcriptional regulator